MKHIIILFFSLLGIAMCDAQEKLLKTADDGFQWYLIKYDNRIYGAQDLSGKDLIASNRGYTDIILIDHFFHVFKGMSQQYCSGDNGICDITGKEIISPNRGYSEIVFHKEDEKFGYFSVKKGNMKGICDMTGKEIVPCNYTNIIYHPYDKVLMYENYDGKYVSLNIGLDDRTKGDFYLASAIPIHTMSYSATNAPSYNSGTNQVSNSGNGTNSEPQQSEYPYGWIGLKRFRIQKEQHGKNPVFEYDMLFATSVHANGDFNKITEVFIVRDNDFPSSNPYTPPPKVEALYYHNTGDGKEYYGAVIAGVVCNKDGKKIGFTRQERKIDNNTAKAILDLITGRTKWEDVTNIKYYVTKSRKRVPSEYY